VLIHSLAKGTWHFLERRVSHKLDSTRNSFKCRVEVYLQNQFSMKGEEFSTLCNEFPSRIYHWQMNDVLLDRPSVWVTVSPFKSAPQTKNNTGLKKLGTLLSCSYSLICWSSLFHSVFLSFVLPFYVWVTSFPFLLFIPISIFYFFLNFCSILFVKLAYFLLLLIITH
jgi:hypothetical protein